MRAQVLHAADKYDVHTLLAYMDYAAAQLMKSMKTAQAVLLDKADDDSLKDTAALQQAIFWAAPACELDLPQLMGVCTEVLSRQPRLLADMLKPSIVAKDAKELPAQMLKELLCKALQNSCYSDSL